MDDLSNNYNNDFNHSSYRYHYTQPGGYPGPEGGGPMTPPPHKDMDPKRKRAMRVVALVLVCTLVGGGAGIGGAALWSRYGHNGETAMILQSERPRVDTMVNKSHDQPMTPEQLYAANLASCVGITVSTQVVNIFGQATTSAASGSGFVLTQDGYIVTNHHVIAEAAKDPSVTIEVAFADGQKFPARLIGSARENDTAVIKIEAQGLTAVTLGDSEQLVVGEPVYAIGNPLGELTYTLTDGIVSAKDRLISTGQDVTLNMLQTNCAINPGNSGGPLFDSYGNVIGITTAKYTQSGSGVSAEGLSFAIPINDVKQIIEDLVEKGYVTGKPYMGVQLSDVSQDAQRYGIPAGAVITYIAEDSAAQKAGLQVNDIIIKLDDTAIDSRSALTAELTTKYKAGQSAVLTVLRQQEEVRLNITFDEKNAETEANNQPQPQPQQPGSNGSSGHIPFPFPFFPW